MTTLAERPGPSPELPDSLAYRTLDALASRWVRLAARSAHGRHPVGFVDRDLRVRIEAIEEVADGVKTFTLVRRDGVALLPPWDPGAHVDVVLPSGGMRQYSLTSDPDDLSHYRIGVRRIPIALGGGGGSEEMHALEVGQHLILKGPRNAFPYIDSPTGYLFLAGGIGITPILPMLRDVVRRDRPWALVYTGRTRASMPFLDELRAITRGQEERVHLWPDEEYGVPDPARILSVAPEGAALYCCGPVPMIEAVRGVLPADNIDALHYERFSPPPVLGGSPFRIRLARTGATLDVGATQSALHAILAVRPRAAYSCRQGFCGTCTVRVLSGVVDHRDRCLTPADREDHMTVCVSRGEGEVVLDL